MYPSSAFQHVTRLWFTYSVVMTPILGSLQIVVEQSLSAKHAAPPKSMADHGQ
jgi:hypothetical protein